MEDHMFRNLSASLVAISLLFVACGKESQENNLATSVPLCSKQLVGSSFESDVRVISFISKDKASYRVLGDDIAWVVDYKSEGNGFTTLTDDLAPGLKEGLVLLQDCKGETLTNWNNEEEVFKIAK